MSGGVPAGCPCCGALPVDWVDDPYAAASSTAIERAVERMRVNPFPDDAHLLGTTQQDARMEHYARVALATPTHPIEGRDADVERAMVTLDAFLAAYRHRPDHKLARPNTDDDLLTWGELRTILAALQALGERG